MCRENGKKVRRIKQCEGGYIRRSMKERGEEHVYIERRKS